MKRAILLLVVVVGGAFYLGWFTFTTEDNGSSEHVNIVIDKNKIHQDEARALQKLQAFEQRMEEQNQHGQASAQAPGQSAAQSGNTPPETGQAAEGSDLYELPEPSAQPTRPAVETAGSRPRGYQ